MVLAKRIEREKSDVEAQMHEACGLSAPALNATYLVDFPATS